MTAVITAEVTRAEVPVSAAAVWAEVTSPAGHVARVQLARAESGWEGPVPMAAPGTYVVRVRASGTTSNGATFSRERTMTPSVWHGGDAEPVRRSSEGDVEERVVQCLVDHLGRSDGLLERLRRLGVDVKSLRACLRAWRRTPDERGVT